MTKDEALKMAIDEIQDLMQHIKDRQPDMLFTGSEYVINACKEAIEQPAQEPVALSTSNNPFNSEKHGLEVLRKTHPAQPLTRDWIGTALERADKDEAFRKGLIGEFAHPLSDDEIRDMATELMSKETRRVDFVDFARAIEAAHGIK